MEQPSRMEIPPQDSLKNLKLAQQRGGGFRGGSSCLNRA